MLFSNIIDSLPGEVFINGAELECVQSITFLGIYIDNKLLWKSHIDMLYRLVSRNTGVINKFRLQFPYKINLFTQP